MRLWDDDTSSHSTRTGDPAHATRVSLVNWTVLRIALCDNALHRAAMSRLDNETESQTMSAGASSEAPIRQTSRKAGTQSYEATAHRNDAARPVEPPNGLLEKHRCA